MQMEHPNKYPAATISADCWLVDWWRRTKTNSSTISPSNHKAWMEYVDVINVMVANRALSQRWDRTTESGKEHRTMTRARPSSGSNRERE